jgi:hypothetical protein
MAIILNNEGRKFFLVNLSCRKSFKSYEVLKILNDGIKLCNLLLLDDSIITVSFETEYVTTEESIEIIFHSRKMIQ